MLHRVYLQIASGGAIIDLKQKMPTACTVPGCSLVSLRSPPGGLRACIASEPHANAKVYSLLGNLRQSEVMLPKRSSTFAGNMRPGWSGGAIEGKAPLPLEQWPA